LGGRRGRLIPSKTRAQAITLIKEACANGARKSKACEYLNLSLRTLERWSKANGLEDKRHCAQRAAPAHKITVQQREEILRIANSKPFCDIPPSKIVPRLADEGRYVASESTFYRILRDKNQLTHRQLSKPVKHHKPKSCTACAPNQVWSWDITYLPSQVRGVHFYLHMIVDIYSRKIVGWSIHYNESSEHAAGLIKQACLDEKVEREQLTLHSDNGSPMKGMTMLSMLQTLGVIPSFSRPSVSDDNPFSESLFRTLKYHPTFPAGSCFETISDARLWVERFTYWYNHEHLHSALKFVTPQQRHTGKDNVIRQKRHLVYQMAKQQHPQRWTGNTRNWDLPETVTLNPDKKRKESHHEKQLGSMQAA